MANKYDWGSELKAKILAKLQTIQSPGSGHLRCPACGHWEWELVDGFVSPPVMTNVWTGDRKSGFPCVAYVCLTCGNALFFSVVALGFALDIGPDMDKLRKEWGRG